MADSIESTLSVIAILVFTTPMLWQLAKVRLQRS